jgi:cytochrome c oxidase subunit 2
MGFELKAGKNDEDKYRCVFPTDASVTKDPFVKKAIEVSEAEKGFFAVSATRGQIAAESHGCFTCHSVDGTPSAGPSWKGLFGSKRRLTNGSTVVATEAYLRESVLNPGSKKVSLPYTSTFRESMPTDMKVTEPDLANIIEYMKTLR